MMILLLHGTLSSGKKSKKFRKAILGELIKGKSWKFVPVLNLVIISITYDWMMQFPVYSYFPAALVHPEELVRGRTR